MKLKLSVWAEREYDDQSRPHPVTLRRMARDGDIPGAVQSSRGRWFVVVDTVSVSLDQQMQELAAGDPIMQRAMGLGR